jgi:hypothetical protein
VFSGGVLARESWRRGWSIELLDLLDMEYGKWLMVLLVGWNVLKYGNFACCETHTKNSTSIPTCQCSHHMLGTFIIRLILVLSSHSHFFGYPLKTWSIYGHA